MIGIFDSGRGGIAAVQTVRKILPFADVAYLADRKNAPYGTKSRGELITLVSDDIRRLCEMGAKKILIACCTASTVYSELSEAHRSVSLPIVAPTARAAALTTKNQKIAVIATEATVLSGAFSQEIRKLTPEAEVCEWACQGLVGLIERKSDELAVRREAERICRELLPSGCDTLILGCTHFSHAKKFFAEFSGNIRIVDSAHVGALEILKRANHRENGKIIYT